MDQAATTEAPIGADTPPECTPRATYRHRVSTRVWHWLNALTVFVMLMSGLMIFNAHPRLYWGQDGANFDYAWLEIGSTQDQGYLRVGSLTVETTGFLGRWKDDGQVRTLAIPGWATLPGTYDLAGAREWHFLFAWLLVIPGLLYWAWSFADRHVQQDLAPTSEQLQPRSLWKSNKDHAGLRLPTGEEARHYNILQKLSYLAVLFLLLPLMVLTGLTMSPGMNAAWGWLLDLFGGRQSARSIHFICAMLIVAFIIVHLVMVVLAGPINEVRSMITGWYRVPERESE
jgi:Ni/Fe-hydrogenase b-type cytochrome subunit